MRLWLLACLAVSACTSSPDESTATLRKQQRIERIKKAEIAAGQPPKVVRHRMEGGELLVLDVPVVLSAGLLDAAKCFVWRDAEFRTTSISCPSGIEGPEPSIDREPESPRP